MSSLRHSTCRGLSTEGRRADGMTRIWRCLQWSAGDGVVAVLSGEPLPEVLEVAVCHAVAGSTRCSSDGAW